MEDEEVANNVVAAPKIEESVAPNVGAGEEEEAKEKKGTEEEYAKEKDKGDG